MEIDVEMPGYGTDEMRRWIVGEFADARLGVHQLVTPAGTTFTTRAPATCDAKRAHGGRRVRGSPKSPVQMPTGLVLKACYRYLL